VERRGGGKDTGSGEQESVKERGGRKGEEEERFVKRRSTASLSIGSRTL